LSKKSSHVQTRQSIKDLEDMFKYISIDSKKYAQNQIVRIKARTQILGKISKVDKLVPERPENDCRALIEDNYRIIYKNLHNSQIDILPIHSARDLSK